MKTVLFIFTIFVSTNLLAQKNVTVNAEQDATLYLDLNGSIANGAGSFNFLGRTQNNSLRRTLIKFPDVGAEIPNTATIDSVFFTFFVDRVGDNILRKTVTLNSVTTAWTTGSSNPSGNEGQGTETQENDATWIHASFPDERWNSPGGDFIVDTLAFGDVIGTGSYTFKGSQVFIDLVQAWKDSTTFNYGIMLLGEENLSQSTSIRFSSVENINSTTIPTLEIYFSEVESGSVTSNEEVERLQTFSLGYNYPNPFNPNTVIPYSIAEAAEIRLSVFNILGQEVEVLVNSFVVAGNYEASFDASSLSTGIYFYRLQTSQGTQTKRLTLLK